MFISTKDQGGRRRSRPYAVSKAARSSKLSLLSGISARTSGSGGSTSTVTQDSYTRHGSPTKKSRRRRTHSERTERGRDEVTRNRKSVDVFEYLVDGDGEIIEEEAAQDDLQPESSVREISYEDSDPECYYRSHLSDSGISMGSSSGEPAHLDAPVRAPLPPLMEEGSRRNSFTYSEGSCYQCDTQLAWAHIRNGYGIEQTPQSPSSVYTYAMPASYQPDHVIQPPSKMRSLTAVPSCLKSAPLSFREKESALKPNLQVFRSFSKINTYILLQMQASIAELEDELQTLDAKAERSEPKLKEKITSKPSGQSIKDKSRRAELCREIHTNLEQYYQALSATYHMGQITHASGHQHLGEFKTWLQSQASPSSLALKLSSDCGDFVSFKQPSLRKLSIPALRPIAMSVLLHMVIPLLIFRFMSGVLNRLIIWSITSATGLLILDRVGNTLDLTHRNCIIVFAGISLAAALFL